jgi:hypothetical protein
MVNIAAIVKIMVNGSLTTSSSIDKKEVCTSLTSAEIQAITSPFLSLKKKLKVVLMFFFYTWHCMSLKIPFRKSNKKHSGVITHIFLIKKW